MVTDLIKVSHRCHHDLEARIGEALNGVCVRIKVAATGRGTAWTYDARPGYPDRSQFALSIA
jgi:hypothetical protein